MQQVHKMTHTNNEKNNWSDDNENDNKQPSCYKGKVLFRQKYAKSTVEIRHSFNILLVLVRKHFLAATVNVA